MMCAQRIFRWLVLVAVAALSAAAGGGQPAHALDTAFTYQGQLQQDGSPASGTCDFQFSLFDAVSGGAEVGSMQTASPVSVSSGLFTVQLDFGNSVFGGDNRWLQIAVRCPVGSGSYTMLSPRQPLTAAPYTLYALIAGSAHDLNCTGCVTSAALAAGAVTNQQVASGIAYSKLSGVPTSLPPTGPAGGSLSGTYPNPTLGGNAVGTTQIQDAAVSPAKINPAGAASGQTLMWNGSSVAWGNPTAGLTLPFAGSVSSDNDALAITNSGNGNAITVTGANSAMAVTANNGVGVYSVAAAHSGPWSGVIGQALSPDGVGVQGTAVGDGVQGISSSGIGVHGISHSGNALQGDSASGAGLYGNSTSAPGVVGETKSGYAGVSGLNDSESGAVYGAYGATSSTAFAAAGVHGIAVAQSGQVIGVEGIANNSPIGTGVVGRGAAVGGYFENTATDNSASVSVNHATSGDGANGVYGETNSHGFNAAGVLGVAQASSGVVVGVKGVATNSPTGTGIVGIGTPTGGYFAGNGTQGHAIALGPGGITVVGAGVGTATPVFIHVAHDGSTAAGDNRCGPDSNATVIDNPYANGHPDAILFVTPHTYADAFTVYYENGGATNCPHNRWTIFIHQTVGLVEGQAFNVMVVNP